MKEKNKNLNKTRLISNFQHLKSNHKGITLIALVITIIVMLILVAVTINMAVNGGLFGYAGRATKDTELAKQGELQLSNGGITVDGVTYESMDAYKASLNCEHDWGEEQVIKEATCSEEGEHAVTCSICGAQKKEKIKKTNHKYTDNKAWEIIPEEGKEKNTCSVCGQLIKRYIVGANIYGYDPSNNKTITTSYTSLGSYDSATEGEYGDGSIGNGNKNQKFEQNNCFDWKILGEDDGQIIITPTIINNGLVSFGNLSGYAHYIEELNKICSIYGQGTYADTTKFSLARNVEDSNSNLIRQETIPNASGARSINLEDLIKIGYSVTEESLTFRKDATNNNIFNETVPYTNSDYQTFFYWNEYTNNAIKPYTFIELKPGERVTIKGIKTITGTVTSLAYKMLSEYHLKINQNYTSYFLANRSYMIPSSSDGDTIQGLLKYVPITAAKHNVFTISPDTAIAKSDGKKWDTGVGRLFRPVVYLRPDVILSYDAENVAYTINPE